MSERYTRLFSLSENLYFEGAPVIIVAGVLLKDNQLGRVLVQLKLRSISTQKIKAVRVRVVMKDVTGTPLDSAIEHQYLDIDVIRDQEFAQKTPIVLPNNATREFSVSVVQVVFGNNSTWTADEGTWVSLVAPVLLRDALNDAELEKEYKRKFGTNCKYIPKEQNGLWYCSCGALNGKQEHNCKKCNCNLAALLAVDFDALEKEKNARIAEEEKVEAAARAKTEAERRKMLKVGTIVAVLLGIIFAIIMTKPMRVIKEAEKIAETGDYMAAISLLDDLNMPDKTERTYQSFINQMDDQIQTAIANKEYAVAFELLDRYSILETKEDYIERIRGQCDHQLEETEQVLATCTTDGYVEMVCSVCGYVNKTTNLAIGHKFSSKIIQKATYTQKGKKVKTCSTCGATEEEDIPKLKYSEQTVEAAFGAKNPTFIGSTCLDTNYNTDGMPKRKVTNFKSTDTVIIAGCLAGISGEHTLVIKWNFPNGETHTNRWYYQTSGDSFNTGLHASGMGSGTGSVSVILESTGVILATYYFTISE